jgi:hypothetical protein
MADDAFRGYHRREYLRRYASMRRAALKRDGARRIDVTLEGRDLDHFDQVKQWVERLNRIGVERGFYGGPLTRTDGRTFTVPPARLSDREIISTALRLASAKIGA